MALRQTTIGILVGLCVAVCFGITQNRLSSQEKGGQTPASKETATKTKLRRAKQEKTAQPRPARHPNDGKLRVIAFGAHPDDCEIRVGGVGAKWAAAGHHVKFVSATNGDIGHWQTAFEPLAKRRSEEVKKADRLLGVATEIFDIHDGELMPSLENRRAVTRRIRRWGADIVLSHRPNDYHPDHRYTGVLVQDSAFMVAVPFFCPETPYLTRNPVFLFYEDRFERPNPMRPDVVVAIDDVIEKKIDALMIMESQFLEGGALGYKNPLPEDPARKQRRAKEVRERFRNRFAKTAGRFRAKLIELYGEKTGRQVRFAEAFEVCEYGRRPSRDELLQMFPMQ